MIRITRQIALDESELEFDFIRASGPGGQNVNKVATAVRLRFDPARSPAISESVRERLLRLGGRRVTDLGVIVLLGRRFRTQEANRRDVLERLKALVARAAEAPKPRKRTKPTAAAKERRLEEKRKRSRIKVHRTSVRRDQEG